MSWFVLLTRKSPIDYLKQQIWDTLEVSHEGVNQVKESKVNILIHQYELFRMIVH